MSGSSPDEAGRRAFLGSAPALRAALVAELEPLIARVPSLGEDEAAVLRHLLAHAGFGESGELCAPSCAALWGEAPSYLPVVPLPAERVKAASRLLLRRGLLRALDEGAVALDHARLRALAGGA